MRAGIRKGDVAEGGAEFKSIDQHRFHQLNTYLLNVPPVQTSIISSLPDTNYMILYKGDRKKNNKSRYEVKLMKENL